MENGVRLNKSIGRTGLFPDFNRNVHCLAGLPFDAVTMVEAIGRVRGAVSDRQRYFLSTPNLSFLIGCLADPRFRSSVINSDLSIVDGMPLVWMARLLGLPIPERVAGSGLFEALRRDPLQRTSVYFLGGPEGAAERACQRLNAQGSGMTCAGYECPGFGSIDDMSSEAIIARINGSGAAFLVVALGAKKGQEWIVRNRARLSVPVVSHLGAVVNFVAGTVHRAPIWMQRSGLEWLWRIKEEPGLWRRYWKDGAKLIHLLATRVLPYAWYLRRHPLLDAELARASVKLLARGEYLEMRLDGAWGQGNLVPLRQCFSEAAKAGKHIKLDMAGVSQVDSAFVGLVMLLDGNEIEQGRQLQIIAPQPEVRRVFSFLCAEYLLVDS